MLLLNNKISLYRYDRDTDSWVQIKSMEQPRLGVGVAVINRLLYAVGGYDGTTRLSSVECYNPDKDCWNLVKDMHECKSGTGKQLCYPYPMSCYSLII